MRVLQQTHGLKDVSSSQNGAQTCFGCFPPMRSTGRGRPLPKKRPKKKSRIVIMHNNIEEEFQATLQTYNCRETDGSRCEKHFFVDVKENGPAGLMRVENYDELLLVNDYFALDKSHDEVLDIFRNVKVDGETRFSLVIRRKPKREWFWIETSAILAPGIQPGSDDQPVIEKAEFKKLDNKYTEMVTTNRYKIQGTQLYLGIKNRQVIADVATRTDQADSKKICKKQRFWQDAQGQVYFEAALCDESGENYIGFGLNNEIIVKDEPEWFEMKERGDEILFKANDLYLGYDKESDQVDAQTSEFRFEEIPGDVELTSHPLSNDNYFPEDYALSPNTVPLDEERMSKRSIVFSSESSSRYSSNSSVSSDDKHLSRSKHFSSVATHGQRHFDCYSFNLNDSLSSGYLPTYLEPMDTNDQFEKNKIYLRKETAV